MNHEPFHIYTAKIAIPKSDIDKKSRYQTDIQKKYPGMNVEFVENHSAHVVELSINAGARPDFKRQHIDAAALRSCYQNQPFKLGHYPRLSGSQNLRHGKFIP